jgi:Family of unknown function (DUF6801)
MSSFTNNKRAAAIGMAGALALGTVASVGSMTSADAATSVYSCTLSVSPTPVPLGLTGSLTMPASVESGRNLAGVPTTMGVTLPAALVTQLTGALGIKQLGGSATGVGLPIVPAAGGAAVGTLPITGLTIPLTGATAGQDASLIGTGTTGSLKAPLPGDYVVEMPTAFNFLPTSDSPVPLGTVPCKSSSPASLATMHVVKAASTTTLKVKGTPSASKGTKLLAIVKAAGSGASGKVVAKEGTKTLKSGTLSNGRKVLALTLKKGKHTIKVLYKGNAGTKASSKSITFRVKG